MYCTNCGAELGGAGRFCARCGAAAAAGESSVPEARPQDVPPPLPAAVARSVPSATDGDVARHAGFWRRVGASLLDSLPILGVALALILALGAASAFLGIGEAGIGALYWIGSMTFSWWYFASAHSSEAQATWGKRKLGIKVVSMEGERISFGKATGRYVLLFLSQILLSLPLLLAAFTKHKQAGHDLIAGTLVVSANTVPEDIARGLAPPKVSTGVVILAVLFGMIPLTGVLAAIAIPAYQDYLVRSQVSEGLAAAAEAKAAVAMAYADTGQFAGISSESLGLATEVASRYVDGIEVMDGGVIVMFGDGAHKAIAGRAIVLVPGVNESQEVVWTCGLAEPPPDVAPAFDGSEMTDVPAKYLPSTCR